MNRRMNLSSVPGPPRRPFRTSGHVPGVSRPSMLGLPVVLVLVLLLAPCVLVLGLLFPSSPPSGPKRTAQPTRSMPGTFTAQSGAVLAGAPGQLLRTCSTTGTASADTDEMGHYEFQNLEPGEYSVSV